MIKQTASFMALALLVCTTLFLPSCIKTYKLVPSESSQGEEHDDKRDVVAENLRSIRVYEQWQTSAMFDVLWMSDHARTAYADMYCTRRGKDESARQKLVTQGLSKNKEHVTFYILADIRDQFHPELDDKQAAWTVYLEVGNQKILPTAIEKAKLDSEILTLFGHRFPRPKFKKPYKITFPTTPMGPTIVNKKPFKMIISSVTRQCELGWHGAHKRCVKKIARDKKRKLVKDEDYYWL